MCAVADPDLQTRGGGGGGGGQGGHPEPEIKGEPGLKKNFLFGLLGLILV